MGFLLVSFHSILQNFVGAVVSREIGSYRRRARCLSFVLPSSALRCAGTTQDKSERDGRKQSLSFCLSGDHGSRSSAATELSTQLQMPKARRSVRAPRLPSEKIPPRRLGRHCEDTASQSSRVGTRGGDRSLARDTWTLIHIQGNLMMNMDVTWMYHGCIMDYLCKMYVEACNVYVRSM